MYYNMRMKTLRRNASVAEARAAAGRTARLSAPHSASVVLLRSIHDAERDLATGHLRDAGSSAEREAHEGALKAKIEATKAALATRERELAAVEAVFDEATARSQQLVDSYVRRMLARKALRNALKAPRKALRNALRLPFALLPACHVPCSSGHGAPLYGAPPNRASVCVCSGGA